jgi:hypothetical protein
VRQELVGVSVQGPGAGGPGCGAPGGEDPPLVLRVGPRQRGPHLPHREGPGGGGQQLPAGGLAQPGLGVSTHSAILAAGSSWTVDTSEQFWRL